VSGNRSSLPARYRRGLVTATLNNSSAFGFSILITSSFGLLSHLHGAPGPGQVGLFALGAVLAFSVIEAVVSRGFRRRPRRQPYNVVLLGTAVDLVSVAAALAVAYGVAALLPATASWGLAPLLAAATYVLVQGADLALAERLEAELDREPDGAEPD